MTNSHKYRNVSLTHDAYRQLINLSNAIVPHVKLSISKTIESLANEKSKQLKSKGVKFHD